MSKPLHPDVVEARRRKAEADADFELLLADAKERMERRQIIDELERRDREAACLELGDRVTFGFPFMGKPAGTVFAVAETSGSGDIAASRLVPVDDHADEHARMSDEGCPNHPEVL